MSSQTNSRELKLRRKLLGTASAVAALTAFQMPGQAFAGDASNSDWHLTVDLGGQFTFNSGDKTVYGDPSAPTPLVGLTNGGDGWAAVNLSTDGWIFGLTYNFGRTGNSHGSFSYYSGTAFTHYSGSGHVSHNKSHKMLDFTIGQDVGLGMFGMDGSSVVSAGVRWANFAAETAGTFSYGAKYSDGFTSHTTYDNELHRTFNGIGPVISWAASTPLGDPGTHLSVDWGVSGAVLFGSRKVWLLDGDNDFTARRHGATVPQAGGYLGLGWHPEDSPASFHVGYLVQANWGVFDGNYENTSVKYDVDRIWHGPYLDLSLQLQ